MSSLMYRLFGVPIFLALMACPTLAQVGQRSSMPAQISGQVRYAQGGQPAFNINVRLDRFQGGVVDEVRTDRAGKFRFTGLGPEMYIVSTRTPGFEVFSQEVELKTTPVQYVSIVIKPDGSGPLSPDIYPASVINANVPRDAQNEYAKGQMAMQDASRLKEGITHLESAVRISPFFFEAQFMLGTAYMDDHQWGRAEAALQQAHKINPKKVEPLIALGELYRQQKQYDKAEKALLEGLKINDNSWQGHFGLARVYWDTGKIYQAGPHVGKALQLKPDLADAYLLGGDIFLRVGQPENALSQFQEYLRLAPQGKFAPQTREILVKIKKALAAKRK
ncbi:MAG TPA: tetratricopeptide repeat protein [Pyrinomonadaceae bacterium]